MLEQFVVPYRLTIISAIGGNLASDRFVGSESLPKILRIRQSPKHKNSFVQILRNSGLYMFKPIGLVIEID
jgi:hypothetical protein